MFRFKNEHAITLVALIITIIILIILAAVTINFAFKSNFIGIATQGTENYSRAQIDESKKMDDIAQVLVDTVSNITSIAGGNGGGDTPDVPPVILSDVDIGKYVNYQPTPGTYWEDTDESGNTKNINDFAGATQNTQFSTETGLKWRIWNVDSSTLYLVSDMPTTATLYLSKAIGYNNGVTLLDNICNSCYKNSSYSGMTARNLKVEDVTAITTVTNSAGSTYGTQPYTYTFTAPYIWTQYEKSSKTNAINNRSTAYSLTTSTTSSSASISPYYALWYNSSMNTTSAYTNAKYKELVTDPASTRTYWLSSRCVSPYSSSNCYFGLQYVNSSGVDYYNLYRYYSGSALSSTRRDAVRPLVSIPLSSCTLKASATSGMDYDISPK